MNPANFIYITNKDDENLYKLKDRFDSTLTYEPDAKQKFFRDHNFIYGYYNTELGFDKEFFDNNFNLNDTFKNLVKNLKEILKWDNTPIIVAVHWGGRTVDEYKELLKKINCKISLKDFDFRLTVSYWGSQSKTYSSNNLDDIKNEITQLVYFDETIFLGIREIIQIQIQTIKSLKENSLFKNKQKSIPANKESLRKLESELEELQKAVRDLRNEL